eukprot:UN04082
MPYKGPVLAQSVYGDIGRRVFQDIDIVIPKEHREKTHDVLSQLGYRYHPRPDSIRNRQANHHEQQFSRASAGNQPSVCIDLHWDFTPPHFNVPFNLWDAEYDDVTVQDYVLPHWQFEELLLLLCVHGDR